MTVPGGEAVDFAVVHAALGENDEAFRWLMTAIDARTTFRLHFIKVDPPFACAPIKDGETCWIG